MTICAAPHGTSSTDLVAGGMTDAHADRLIGVLSAG